METQLNRLKEALEAVNVESDHLRGKEVAAVEAQRKLERQLRDLREDHVTLQSRENDLIQKKSDMEKQVEVSQAEVLTVRNDLKLAMKRIEDLQLAIAEEIGSDEGSEDSEDSEDDSDLSDYVAAAAHKRSWMKSAASPVDSRPPRRLSATLEMQAEEEEGEKSESHA